MDPRTPGIARVYIGAGSPLGRHARGRPVGGDLRDWRGARPQPDWFARFSRPQLHKCTSAPLTQTRKQYERPQNTHTHTLRQLVLQYIPLEEEATRGSLRGLCHFTAGDICRPVPNRGGRVRMRMYRRCQMFNGEDSLTL